MTALRLVWCSFRSSGRGSIPGHEIEHPMAVVILGGLVTSTLLNLFIMPVLYLRFGKSRKDRIENTPGPAPSLGVAD